MDAAVSVLLTRPTTPGCVEVLLGRRAPGRLLEGTWAFPGGGVADEDRRPSGRGRRAGLDADDAARRVAVLRELFEETGILAVPGAERVPATRRLAHRSALRGRRTSLAEVLEAEGLEVALAEVRPVGRFHLAGFVVPAVDIVLHRIDLPAGEPGPPDPWLPEVTELAWRPPGSAVAAYDAGALAIPDTVRRPLEALAAGASPEGDESPRTHAPLRGTMLVPVRTPTLPPATHTNVYVLGTGAERIVVDPASPYPEEQARLDAILDRLTEDGAGVREIWLTHHHPDHVGGAAHLKARLGVPVRAHPLTADRVAPGLVDAPLADGETVTLEGPLTQRFTAVHTPGHAPGHLCFSDETTGATVVGDMMAGVGTIVIDPPEGDMAAYLASLGRLRDLSPAMVLPAHGPPSAEAVVRIDAYVAHRRAREEAIVESLRQGADAIPGMVAAVYTDVPRALHPFAERSVLAHLEKLVAEGRVRRDGDAWRLR